MTPIWDYLTMTFNVNEEDNAEDIERTCDVAGSDGWELVSLCSYKDGQLAIFKRPRKAAEPTS